MLEIREICIFLTAVYCPLSTTVYCDFFTDREQFIHNEELKMMGYHQVLNEKELLVNAELMRLKHAEYDAGLADPSSFLPAQHFFKARKQIEESEVFKFIKKFPKGAALHGHTKAMSSGDFLFNLTYMEDLYACESGKDLLLHFFHEPDNSCQWEMVANIRAKNSSYDDYLRSRLTLIVEDPHETYEDINMVWKKFEAIFTTTSGAKLIYSPFRGVNDPKTVEEYIKTAVEMKTYLPDFVVGFDLIGQEDLGKPLISFVSLIQQLQKEKMQFYFHAGETNWYGTGSDRNLIDAVLLGAKRIGHGFALAKHPDVLAYCKKHDIAIEVSPISNQVLMLVEDMRNHPAAMYFAEGQNVVITNDDPAFWGAKGLSYDWYMAFMGMTSRDGDLRILKQLAHNAIKYSGAKSTVKAMAMHQWGHQWEAFLDDIICDIPEERKQMYLK